MSLNCGIVGLPNVGKSTIFSAVTSAPAEAANYPFCIIDPNVGMVNVPDARLDKIVELIPPARIVPATVEFVDIAGLVKGASQGEGLGNRFLGAIKEVGVIAHVVRCFDNGDIIHVNNRIDPASDIETIDIELALADYETVDKRYQKQSKLGRISKEQQKENENKRTEAGKRLSAAIAAREKDENTLKTLRAGNADAADITRQEFRLLQAELREYGFRTEIAGYDALRLHTESRMLFADADSLRIS